jgi:5'-nucleotidase
MARVLVTNDDGVLAPGLLALAQAVSRLGHDLLVVAPLDDRSGCGAAIGPVHLADRVAYEAVPLAGLDGIPTYGLDGPPGLCVLTACLGAFGAAPDLVVSGINPGTNTGHAVIHSGTVGAALTANVLGLPGVAVSLDVGEPMQWDTAAAFGAAAARWSLEWNIPTTLNVNAPDLALHDVLGVRPARLAAFGTVRAAFEARDGHLQLELRSADIRLDDDTDVAYVRRGYVAVTELVGAVPAGGSGTAVAADRLAATLARDLATAS